MSDMSDEIRARNRTLRWVRENTSWVRAEALDAGQREAWKRGRQVFSVVYRGAELFPSYLFIDIEGQLQPRPSIRLVLGALGPDHEAWALAAWFIAANAWLVDRDGSDARCISPTEALERGLDDRVVQAAKRNATSYVA